MNNDQEYFAFDRFTSEAKPIIPASYGVVSSARREVHSIAEAYREKFKNTWGFQKIPIPVWMKRACFVAHDISFAYDSIRRPRKSAAVTIQITDNVKFYRFSLGEYCGALPLPGSFDESLECKRGILVSRLGVNGLLRQSKYVWKALQSLNVIVRNDKKQILLLKGEPGSGKEIFGDAVHYGSVRAKETKPERLAVAGVSLPTLRETLFGSESAKGELVDGLIAKAKGGTLFLDEFDKASTNSDRRDFGSSLLRVLESDTYYPEGSRTERDVEDVNWIMAGAFSDLKGTQAAGSTDESETSVMPRDIWSRYTDQLELWNPVMEAGYARAMFVYWHFVETARWLRSDESAFPTLKADRTLAGVIAAWLLWGTQKADDGTASANPLKPGRTVLRLARDFEHILVQRGRKELERRAREELAKKNIRARRRIPARRYSDSKARAVWGVRTIRQASTAVSRELRMLVIGMLGVKPDKIEEELKKTQTTDKLMGRVNAVLRLLRSGE